MDKSAIQEIANLAVEAANKSTDFVILRDAHSLKDTEKFLPRPKRFRGHFKTTLVSEFCSYLNDHSSSDDTRLFIDHEQGSALAILDMGKVELPDWGQHRAILELKATPEYADLQGYNNRPFKQRDFIDFVEDYAACFQFLNDAGELLDTKVTIANLRRLKVDSVKQAMQEVKNFGGSLSVMESVEVKTGDTLLPPAGFKFICKPHDDFSQIEAACQLRADVQDDTFVQLKYRIMGLEGLKKAIAGELLDLLEAGLDQKDIKRYLGGMTYQSQ